MVMKLQIAILIHVILTTVVGARWQGDTPPSPPLGLPGGWYRADASPCLNSKLPGQICPRAAASKLRKQLNEMGQDNRTGQKLKLFACISVVKLSISELDI